VSVVTSSTSVGINGGLVWAEPLPTTAFKWGDANLIIAAPAGSNPNLRVNRTTKAVNIVTWAKHEDTPVSVQGWNLGQYGPHPYEVGMGTSSPLPDAATGSLEWRVYSVTYDVWRSTDPANINGTIAWSVPEPQPEPDPDPEPEPEPPDPVLTLEPGQAVATRNVIAFRRSR
jgi:hypothetical protein